MRAVICQKYRPPELLVVEDRPSLVPDIRELVIGVETAGVNFRDLLSVQNLY